MAACIPLDFSTGASAAAAFAWHHALRARSGMPARSGGPARRGGTRTSRSCTPGKPPRGHLPPRAAVPARRRRSFARPRRSCCSRRPSPRCLAAAAAVLLLLCFHWERLVGDINAGGVARRTPARYEGRWLRGESSAEADWPCSSVRFAIGTGGRTTAAVTLVWSGVRVRLNATVHDGEGAVLAAHTLKAPAWDVPFLGPHRAKLPLPGAAAEVRCGSSRARRPSRWASAKLTPPR